MKTTVDYRELTAEQQAAARNKPEVRAGAWRVVRAQAFELERKVKMLMPVDTGRARASWGHSTPPASAADGIWIEDEAGLEVIEGSNVEYIGALNEGHSQQREAGFIDAAAASVGEALDRALDELLRGLL